MKDFGGRARLGLTAATAALVLAGCDGQPLDFDLRRNGASTAQAAMNATEPRPAADNRGVISYPNYQVAVANPGDTPAAVATRVGVPPAQLAQFNGLPLDAPLNGGTLLVLPSRVSEPSLATGAVIAGPIRPGSTADLTTLAGAAIDRAQQSSGAIAPAPGISGVEPIRHRVERGETAFTIARRYGISERALAEWNGLDGNLTVTEGRILIIPPVAAAVAPSAAPLGAAPLTPVPLATPPAGTLSARPLETVTTAPGQGSVAPLPPSSARPLPANERPAPSTSADAAREAPPAPTPAPTTAVSQSRLAAPVPGAIARAFAKGKNDGVDFAASPGTPVRAAEAGTVAAVTKDANGVPIVVVRHSGNLLTVYAGVDGLSVGKGDSVSRGQSIGQIRSGGALHFEVREGFEAVDPAGFL